MRLTNVNNFDLIRLVAALEVVIIHASVSLGLHSPVIELFHFFPGVPVFFFISGFLIFASYQSCQSSEQPLLNFFKKRILRLYPALFFCFAFSVALLVFSGYLHSVESNILEYVVWGFTSLSIFQFYNPDFLRDFGVGVINGSLWTISVELQFYLLTPFIYWILRKSLVYGVLLILIFAVANILNSQFNTSTSIAEKLFAASFVPWIYMFLLGAVLAARMQWVEKLLRLNTRLVFLLYFTVWWASHYFGLGWGNDVNPLAYPLLIVLILKATYTKQSLSDKLLARNDISYGVYIFHMPIINYLIYMDLVGATGFVLAIVSTVIMALVSWQLVEKPALKLKSRRLKSVRSNSSSTE